MTIHKIRYCLALCVFMLCALAPGETILINAWSSFDWSKVPAGATVQVGDQINRAKIKPLQMKGCKGGITIIGPARIEGFYFDFAGIHGLRWENLTFSNCGQFRAPGATWIYAKNCLFTDLAPGNDIMIQLGPGNDDWGFEGCTIQRAGCGIYTRFGAGVSPNRLAVLNCAFKDIGTTAHPHQDSHAIGIQEGHGHRIFDCHTENTGEAISFYARSTEMMTDIIVRGCTIRNVRACANTQGGGIVVSGSHDATNPRAGWRSGIQIVGNDIAGTDGNGIRSNARDRVIVENNKISKWGLAGMNTKPIEIINPFGAPDLSGVINNTILK